MPIEVTCECGRKATVPDAHAGKKGKCPGCGAVMWIPAAPDADLADVLADRLKRAAPPPAPTPAVVPDPPGFVRYEVTQPPPRPADPRVQDVRVVDASMPFESMCWLVFKWTMAAIPTMLLLWFVSWLIRLIK